MEKRVQDPRGSLSSNPQKRLKPSEGVAGGKRKTAYFFQPTNTLTNPTIKSKPKEQIPTEIISTVKNEEPQATVESNKPTKSHFVPDQSSDDSFDGIRWKTSPQKFVNSMPITSSPLKPVTAGQPDLSATVLNEQTNSFLSKFGYGAEPLLSQTPNLHKTNSDISARVKSLDRLETSPTLTRAKSFGTPSDIVNRSSRETQSHLSNWIDKFDMNDLLLHVPEKPHDFVKPYEKLKEVSEVKKESVEDLLKGIDFSDDFSNTSASSPVMLKTVDSDNSEDPFSDDEGILQAIASQKPSQRALTPKPSSPKNIALKRPAKIEGTKLLDLPIDDNDSDDPFEDDLDFVELKNLSRQPSMKLESLCDDKKVQQFEKGIRELQRSAQVKAEDNSCKLSFSRPDFVRYQIVDMIHSNYKVQDRDHKQIIMTVRDEDSKITRVMVRGEYSSLDFQKNDVIHLILTCPQNPRLVDDTRNLLIWNPDTLISSTTVAQQLSCSRKTVLQYRFQFPGETSTPLIIGLIVHEIFQKCFVDNDWTMKHMLETLATLAESFKLQIYTLGDVMDDIIKDVKVHLPYLHEWFTKYYKKPPTPIPTNRHNQNVMFSISEALDIEENIWSPMFGLKGMVDVSLDATLQDKSSRKKVLLPMEIKTGREYILHHAQSALYALLFKDRYDIDVLSFLLVYTKEKLIRKHDINPADLKALVNLRNRLTKYFKENCQDFPQISMLSDCDRCDIQEACMVVNKIQENGTPETSGISPELYKSLTGHLEGRNDYLAFYKYWDTLITREESVLTKLKKDLWILGSAERELGQGKALANMRIESSDDTSDKQRSFVYTFVRDEKSEIKSSFQSTQLGNFDKVIISDERGKFTISQGWIKQIRPNYIKVTTLRRLLTTDYTKNKFSGGNGNVSSVLHRTQAQSEPCGTTFRIDKDDMFYGMGLARFNLLNLFLASGDTKRRELIVDLKPPSYGPAILHDIDRGNFNPDQVKAFEKVLTTKDYSLILGMPGTGKTTVIAQIIKYIVDNNQTVLLASYTHSAVDNILLKVKDYGINILRIGRPARVHKDLVQFVPQTENIGSYQDFLDTYMSAPVVASTCLGVNDMVFNMRHHFDYCIIDEASQVSMPVSLGPLRFCDKFILVGDHYQLPPLVTNPQPEVKKGLSQSLFKILADAHPQSVTELTYQYRMCSEIMFLSNKLIYNSRLKCGSDSVAKQSLQIPEAGKIDYQISLQYETQLKKDDLWMDVLLNEKNKVLFLNHDQLSAQERAVGEKIENPTEVELIRQIIEGFTLCGVPESSIGVMSLYKYQLRSLKRTLLHKRDVEVLTADQFQGRDKDCIIISLVRSNPERKVGDLLKEWRRINVAITRSRSKLILLGSKSTLSEGIIKDFINLLGQKGWVHDLPPQADKFYSFPLPSQPPTQIPSSIGAKILNTHPVIKDIVHENTN